MPSRPQRILFYRLGSLGDHLVAIPSYRLARRAFPGAEFCLLTNIPIAAKAAAAEAVLTGSGLVDRFMTYVVGERNPLALLKLIWRIRRYGADTVVYLVGSRGIAAAERDGKFLRLCGVKRVIGLPVTGDLQNCRSLGVDATGTPWMEAEASRLARCIAELGDAAIDDPASWDPNLTAAEKADAATLLAPIAGAPFFAFSIGTKDQAKDWGADKWTAFFRALTTEHPGHALVLVGAPDEAAISETIADAWREGGNPALNLCGASSPRVSAAVMKDARMYFGHDSGPIHLAASVGTPSLGVYSARTLAGQWFPYGKHVRILYHWVDCGGCKLATCTVQGKKCILSITVPEVLAATREHLAATEIRD